MLASLEAEAHSLVLNGIAPSTSRVYSSARNAFLHFCSRLNLNPLPASEHTLILFVAELHQSKATSTIHTYMAGVRHFHIISGYSNPLENKPKLQLALKGCKRRKPPRACTRLPITPYILREIKSTLSKNFDDTMIWAAMCTGFFGFLRAGEFTVDGVFDPSAHLSLQDFSVDSHTDPSVIRVTIKKSKTDQFGTGAYIFLARTNSDLCPVTALLNYLAARPPTDGPMFVFEDGSYLSRNKLVQSLNRSLIAAGIDPQYYKGHSFRIGAATTAATMGVQDSLIQKLGRWTSDAFRLYVRTPPEELSQVCHILAQSS